jgi:hypothetical protein
VEAPFREEMEWHDRAGIRLTSEPARCGRLEPHDGADIALRKLQC